MSIASPQAIVGGHGLKPQWYGAPVTSTGLDATAAVQACLNDAFSLGKHVVIDDDFTCLSQITIPNGLQAIEGTGSIYPNNSSYNTSPWKGASKGSVIRFPNSGGLLWQGGQCVISGLAIIGGGSSSGVGGCGIQGQLGIGGRLHTRHVTIGNFFTGYLLGDNYEEIHVDMNVIGCVKPIAYLDGGITIETFFQCKFTACSYGPQVQGDRQQYYDCTCEENSSGIRLIGPNIRGFLWRGGYSELTGTAGRAWSANAPVSIGETMGPTTPTGRVYICITGGNLGTTESAWNIGSNTIQGSCVFADLAQGATAGGAAPCLTGAPGVLLDTTGGPISCVRFEHSQFNESDLLGYVSTGQVNGLYLENIQVNNIVISAQVTGSAKDADTSVGAIVNNNPTQFQVWDARTRNFAGPITFGGVRYFFGHGGNGGANLPYGAAAPQPLGGPYAQAIKGDRTLSPTPNASSASEFVCIQAGPVGMTWSQMGGAGSGAVPPGWVIIDSNGNLQQLTTGCGAGGLGAAHPAWASTVGATTSDGTNGAVWTCRSNSPAQWAISATVGTNANGSIYA